MSAFEIYFLFMADTLRESMIVMSVGALITILPLVLIQEEVKVRTFRLLSSIWLLIMVTSVSISIFFPSSKTLAAMYIIPAAQQNEDLQELFGDSLDILKGHMRQWKEEIAE